MAAAPRLLLLYIIGKNRHISDCKIKDGTIEKSEGERMQTSAEERLKEERGRRSCS